MTEQLLKRLIIWIKASKGRTVFVKIFSLSYCLSFAIYMVFFFKIKDYGLGVIELICAILFYFILWIAALTFKKSKL